MQPGVDDSGEGRWTINAAIEEAVPADVLSAALYARFRSREQENFADKLLSAMRNKFGGHVEPKARPMTRHPRPAPPCVLVIFGAAGDLTQRLLMPALYNLRAREACCRRTLPSSASPAARRTTAPFARNLPTALRSSAMQRAAATTPIGCPSACSICRATSMTLRLYERLAICLARTDQAQHTGGNYLFYLATPPQAFATIPKRLGDAAFCRRQDGHWRRVIIEKPFGTDLRSAQDLNRQTPRRARREPDLPDRSLSRQGDRPEHHGAALRQRHVRAAVVPQPHRSCADHRRGDGQRRAARQVLRRDRRFARHGAEPSLPAAHPDRDGAADLL